MSKAEWTRDNTFAWLEPSALARDEGTLAIKLLIISSEKGKDLCPTSWELHFSTFKDQTVNLLTWLETVWLVQI